MEYSAKVFWEKAKTAREFVAGIVAMVGVLYGLSWVFDDIFAHVHVQADHQWGAYRVWHAWWWLVMPLGFVAGGRLWNPRSERARVLRGGLWVVGVCWLALLGAASSIRPLFYFISHLGFLWGTVAFCCLLPAACIALGYLFELARRRWPLLKRLKSEISCLPDRETDGKLRHGL
jgi:hypothetical protein